MYSPISHTPTASLLLVPHRAIHPCIASPFSQPYLLLLKDDTDGDKTVIEIVLERRWHQDDKVAKEAP